MEYSTYPGSSLRTHSGRPSTIGWGRDHPARRPATTQLAAGNRWRPTRSRQRRSSARRASVSACANKKWREWSTSSGRGWWGRDWGWRRYREERRWRATAGRECRRMPSSPSARWQATAAWWTDRRAGRWRPVTRWTSSVRPWVDGRPQWRRWRVCCPARSWWWWRLQRQLPERRASSHHRGQYLSSCWLVATTSSWHRRRQRRRTLKTSRGRLHNSSSFDFNCMMWLRSSRAAQVEL